jgi:PPOX class probable F420-dependent enzyme
MPKLPFPDAVRELLDAPNPAVIATVRSDGHPVTVATWYDMEGDRILVNMDEGRKRLEHLRRDPRVSVTVLKDGDWSTHVSVVGKVVEMYDDEGLADIDRLCQRYGGGDTYPYRDRARVTAVIEVERWHAWGELKDA